jgi:cell division protein FtsL
MRASTHTETVPAAIERLIGRLQSNVRPRPDRRRSRPDDARRRRRSHVGYALIAAAVLVACGLAHVWVRLQVTEFGYELNTTREIIARLEQEQRELETELAMLTAPQRLTEEARRRLRLSEPKPGQVVVLR